jgi:DNA-binding protein HU-beta
VPLTQTQLAAAVADKSGLSRAQAKTAIEALEEVVLDEIGNAEKVKIGNLVQLTVRVKPPTKAREGRNPSTGEAMTIGPKPASVDVRARVLAKTKAALPPLDKAKRRLAA